ncbi:hypothetical protein NO995_09395 [Aestuariibaculum sp. M13]|uniref:hypothetical protein n=1 Tax=Aestuariibaculum sp. M13 TaxID=2967132 RepID=UPI00215A0B4B|nr:hypothetical protein [Aestuariibaculum sp. M13]MCR8667895.1 hypothetical protein [Aestuariibaculum sp. M13]
MSINVLLHSEDNDYFLDFLDEIVQEYLYERKNVEYEIAKNKRRFLEENDFLVNKMNETNEIYKNIIGEFMSGFNIKSWDCNSFNTNTCKDNRILSFEEINQYYLEKDDMSNEEHKI